MNVLITGGMGVNGAVLARLLVSKGIRPVLLDNRMDLSLIGDIKNDVDLVEGDVLDPHGLEKVVADNKISHIAHLAALMPGPAESDPRLAMKIGVGGTVNVLEVARARNIQRVVFTSSKAVYGEITGEQTHPDYVPVFEFQPQRPVDLYGVIKVCCESMGNYYRERYSIEFVSLRFSSIYGPGKQARHGVLSLYGQLIEDVMSGKEVVIPCGGDQLNDALYVGDVARAIFLALKAESPRQWTFNIGTGKGVTLRDFAQVLGNIYPSARIEIGPGLDFRKGEKQSYCIFNISKAREQLGYSPDYDLERGIKEYIETIRRLRS
ncbi:MAG: NAD-dependent epimerase/dehydratase family protein [Candidatus Binatia bacterium]